jgi:hypothetical protein
MRYKTCSKDAILRSSKGEDEVSYGIIGHYITIVMFNICVKYITVECVSLELTERQSGKNITMQDEKTKICMMIHSG